MSRIGAVSVLFVLALVKFMPLPAPLPLHNYPFGKTAYASSAEWPLVSAQNHWNDPPAGHGGHAHHIAHTHVELWAPLWAEVPRETFSIKGRIQLFHVNGGVWGWRDGGVPYGVFPNGLGTIDWGADAGPIIGDPVGVVIRNFTLEVDPSKTYANGSGGAPFSVPINGWFPVGLTVYTEFADGDLSATELIVSLYMTGDPSVPETNNEFAIAGYHHVLSARTSVNSNAGGTAHGTGQMIVDYRDQYLPILAPQSADSQAVAFSYAYARNDAEYPAPELDRAMQINDLDLHNGVAGTVVRDLPGAGAGPDNLPIDFFTGAHKVAAVWKQNTGTVGNTSFPPNEEAWTLLVVASVGGDVPPPQPTDPVDCAGTYGPMGPWVQVAPNLWRRMQDFTVTQQPANGGKSCAVVVNGG